MALLARLIVAVAALLAAVAPALAQVHVDGYTKKDGTYVAPHWRSSPDSSVNNNWSTSPNVNPFTGQQGTHTPRVEPYQPMQPIQPVQRYGTQPRRGW